MTKAELDSAIAHWVTTNVFDMDLISEPLIDEAFKGGVSWFAEYIRNAICQMPFDQWFQPAVMARIADICTLQESKICE